MVFTEADKAFIKNLYLIKGYEPRIFMSDFSGIGLKREREESELDKLLTKLHKTGATNRKYMEYGGMCVRRRAQL